jgi:hypothetical protein
MTFLKLLLNFFIAFYKLCIRMNFPIFIDKIKIRSFAVMKVIDFYQEMVWSSVSTILDHVILWWSSDALAAQHTHGSKYVKDRLQQLIKRNDGMIFHILNV